ncbi:flagellar hook-length control protein FliK [uncultured Sphingorhabdus sp.]|uniref:flagellar hook-length control protein FliK n=1 Tax=uncultured Sphingorhabdus sp. TaxID=1686106 RepID=UPI002603A47B|nr:flagellar hook-length control protein FliK [uncultured Sphingorhabdus sp.]HMS19825.1 flagellar hook-length control protein FliK [Sphingorhabdus sp.]
MNPLTGIFAIRAEAALPVVSFAPALQSAVFETQMTMALDANNCENANAATQETEASKTEIPIDSSISVATPSPAPPLVITAHIVVDHGAKVAEPDEAPPPVQPASQPQLLAIFAPLPAAPPPTVEMAGQRTNKSLSVVELASNMNGIRHFAGQSPIQAETGAAEPLAPTNITEALPFEASALSVVIELAQKTKLQPERPLPDLRSNDWAARLSQEILLARESATSELTFRLTPRHLGTLEVGLADTPQGLLVELRPSNEEAKTIVAREEPRLIEELRQRGVAVADPTVQSGASGDGRHSRNGAIPRPFLPFPETDRNTVQDQDQPHGQPTGRYA